MWKKIFVTRLIGSSWIGVLREVCKRWKHAVSIVFHSVIMSKKTEDLSITISQKNFETFNRTLAALRTFYQRTYHNNFSHLE